MSPTLANASRTHGHVRRGRLKDRDNIDQNKVDQRRTLFKKTPELFFLHNKAKLGGLYKYTFFTSDTPAGVIKDDHLNGL